MPVARAYARIYSASPEEGPWPQKYRHRALRLCENNKYFIRRLLLRPAQANKQPYALAKRLTFVTYSVANITLSCIYKQLRVHT